MFVLVVKRIENVQIFEATMIKKNQIFLINKEIQNGAVAKSNMTNGLLIHIWGNIWAFPQILGRPSSYMTLQLLHSEFFLIYEENLIFFFISVLTSRLHKGTLGGGT